jgi:hypothetical protein
MSKTKVYLAKSNKANPNVVSMVRQLLSNYDVSVVEYTGGSYTDKPMLDCDFLVVIPEFPSSVVDLEYEIKLGRGLFEQINVWLNKKSKKSLIIISNNGVIVSGFKNLLCTNNKDYINYGVLTLENENRQNFYHVCRNTFSLKTVVPKLESEYYVLIGRKI